MRNYLSIKKRLFNRGESGFTLLESIFVLTISSILFVIALPKLEIPIRKSIELVYGFRNFIGNANKFSKSKVFITIKSDSEISEIIIEDDGKGYPKDILSKIGEPYLKVSESADKNKRGLGLGIFIGKTLLEKNAAKLVCRNSKTRGGAEVNILWKNKDLKLIS